MMAGSLLSFWDGIFSRAMLTCREYFFVQAFWTLRATLSWLPLVPSPTSTSAAKTLERHSFFEVEKKTPVEAENLEEKRGEIQKSSKKKRKSKQTKTKHCCPFGKPFCFEANLILDPKTHHSLISIFENWISSSCLRCCCHVFSSPWPGTNLQGSFWLP